METDKLIVLTPEDITKAQSNILTAKQLDFLLGETPKNHIFKRPGKGGQSWEYVTGTYMKKVLNLMFGWDWDFEVVKFDIQIEAKQCIVLGKLTCRTETKTIIKNQFGRADIKFKKESKEPLDLGNDLKAATTDALKKCASELGIASDIYGKNEFKRIKIVDEKPTTDQLMLLEDLIEQANLNDTEIQRIKFDLPSCSASDVSLKIEGLMELVKSNDGITNNVEHLKRIEKQVEENKK